MYPEGNNAGVRNGWEPGRTHPGPFLQGQDARVLMNKAPGDHLARRRFEEAPSPGETEVLADTVLAEGRHLGDPVDYGVYLTGRIADDADVPDFNLDADRGYGHRCWDWDRDPGRPVVPPINDDPDQDAKYTFAQPCTAPEGFCNLPQQTAYDPNVHLATHYLPGKQECGEPRPVTGEEIDQAGMPPTGKER